MLGDSLSVLFAMLDSAATFGLSATRSLRPAARGSLRCESSHRARTPRGCRGSIGGWAQASELEELVCRACRQKDHCRRR